MLESGAPEGSRPVKVPPVIEVVWFRRKSSADSISCLLGLSGREPVAILPSGLPVENVKLCAIARMGVTPITANSSTEQIPLRIFLLSFPS